MMDRMVYFYPDGHENHFERGHPERPERVEIIREYLNEAGVWGIYPKLAPIKLSDDLIRSVHSPAYLNLLEMTCRRGGHLDPDTYTTPASWNLAFRAAGGAAAVAGAVWDGYAQRGFALTRPPGHHAMRGQGMGFCLINNVAIVAEYLLQQRGAQKLAIIDLDLHHGNGTQDIFWTREDVFYTSTHQSPLYPGSGKLSDTGAGSGVGWTANFPLPPASGDEAFLAVMDEMILPLLDLKQPQMILVSYGFDPHWLDPLGQLLLTAGAFFRLIRKLSVWADLHCNGKLALVLEGGYDLNAAKACSLAAVKALVDENFDDPYPCPYKETGAWRSMLREAHGIWD